MALWSPERAVQPSEHGKHALSTLLEFLDAVYSYSDRHDGEEGTMSREALVSVARSIEEVKQVITTLSQEEWARASGCADWSVRDLVAHMSSNYKETVEPSPPPPEPL